MEKNLGAIILAAGKGKRMKAEGRNKVTMLLNNKPLIIHILDVLEKMNLENIVVVIGHEKQSVIDTVHDKYVLFAEDDKQIGTGNATRVGVEKLPSVVTDVFVLQGDDSFFYNEKLLSKLKDLHFSKKAAITMLTIRLKNPTGAGRIVRNENGEITAIAEEKDATDEQRNIDEVNPACYVFDVTFLKKYLPQISKSQLTGEYYLTSLIDIAIKNNEKIETVQAGEIPWRGINTPEELKEAEKILTN